MPRYTVPCPSGDVVIRHTSYSGCALPDSKPDDPLSAAAQLAGKAARLAKRGYPVDLTTGVDGLLTSIEVSTPDDAVMVGDIEGVYRIVPYRVPAWKCWECGDLVADGERCPCTDEPEDY